MDAKAESRVLAARLLDSWFTNYARYREDRPATGDQPEDWKNWRLKRTFDWNGVRNICRYLAEWVDSEVDDQRLDSEPLWLLSGTTDWSGVSPETWNAAWLLCNRLRPKIGTMDGAIVEAVLAAAPQAAEGETSATVAALLRRIAQEVEGVGLMPETRQDIDRRLLHGPNNEPGWLTQRYTELVNSDGDRSLRATLRATLTVLGRIMSKRNVTAEEIRHLRACAELLDGGGNGPGDPVVDDSAWLDVTKLWPEHFKTYRRFKVFLDSHPEIHQRRSPKHRQRLQVHAGEWLAYWTKQDQAQFDKLGSGEDRDPPSIADDPEAEAEFLAGAAERMARLRARNKAGK